VWFVDCELDELLCELMVDLDVGSVVIVVCEIY